MNVKCVERSLLFSVTLEHTWKHMKVSIYINLSVNPLSIKFIVETYIPIGLSLIICSIHKLQAGLFWLSKVDGSRWQIWKYCLSTVYKRPLIANLLIHMSCCKMSLTSTTMTFSNTWHLSLGRECLIGPHQQQSDTPLEGVVFQRWDTMSYFYPNVAILYVYIFVLVRMDIGVNEHETSLCHCNLWVMRIKVLVWSYLDSLMFKCWTLTFLII